MAEVTFPILPWEIRNMIYRHAFGNGKIQFTEDLEAHTINFPIALTQVSRSIDDETREYLENAFTFPLVRPAQQQTRVPSRPHPKSFLSRLDTLDIPYTILTETFQATWLLLRNLKDLRMHIETFHNAMRRTDIKFQFDDYEAGKLKQLETSVKEELDDSGRYLQVARLWGEVKGFKVTLGMRLCYGENFQNMFYSLNALECADITTSMSLSLSMERLRSCSRLSTREQDESSMWMSCWFEIVEGQDP
jgi:hypothetical protein